LNINRQKGNIIAKYKEQQYNTQSQHINLTSPPITN